MSVDRIRPRGLPGKAVLTVSIATVLLVLPATVRGQTAPAIHETIASDTSRATPGGCPERGVLDGPTKIATEQLRYTINGWVLSRDSIARVEVLAEGKVLAQGVLETRRADVRKVFSRCSNPQASGFSVPVNLADIPPHTNALRVRAVPSSGLPIEVGVIPVDLRTPFGMVDTVEPIRWRGRNQIGGWALSATEGLTVRVLANGSLIGAAAVSLPRPDVAAIFRHWPSAASSGFVIDVPFERLPRGRYPLTLELVAGNGASRVLPGPEVINDRSFGYLDTREAIGLDGKNVLSGWAISATGKARVRVTAVGRIVATMPADRLRSDVGKAFPRWPQAARSGFEHLLALNDLPRGRYRLQIELIDDDGVFDSLEGPDVFNDFPIGSVQVEQWRLLNPGDFQVSAWVADEDGIADVSLVTEAGSPLGNMGVRGKAVPFQPIARVFPEDERIPAPAVTLGSEYAGMLKAASLPIGLSRVTVRVRDRKGVETRLPGPLVLRSTAEPATVCAGEKLHVFFPWAGEIFRRGFPQMFSLRRLAQGGCTEVGARARIEYLRTTTGDTRDFHFSPDFADAARIVAEGSIGSTALNEFLTQADDWGVPLLLTLDGGPWADAMLSAPEVDIVDVLEQDPSTVQWNQHGRAEPDDALSDLPGSISSPQLARMMSLNRYNRRFRFYKKRNLQQAVRSILGSAFVRGGGYLAVNLDPDQYINPWFYQKQWYDYNPDTLRQFREWLLHRGPYADGGTLAPYRYGGRMSLVALNALAGTRWDRIEEIDPPRGRPNYDDRWHQIWTQFKRHLVDRHYNDLADWTTAAGVSPSRVYTSQTFIQTDVAVAVDDEARGWTDEAGVSVEGAKPANGHLGAILYGPASRDEGSVRQGYTLLQNLRRVDAAWGVVEFHPATIAFAQTLPSHEQCYQSIGRTLNAGAKFLSPMWGTHVADRMVYPRSFRAYDAFTGSDFEYQLVWWLLARKHIPAGSLLYPFGNTKVRSADGWTATAQAEPRVDYGVLRLRSEDDELVLSSPRWDGLRSEHGGLLRVSGRWGEAVVVTARIVSDADNAPLLTLKVADGNPVVGRLPRITDGFLRGIDLHWSVPNGGAVGEVDVDEVTLTFTQ